MPWQCMFAHSLSLSLSLCTHWFYGWCQVNLQCLTIVYAPKNLCNIEPSGLCKQFTEVIYDASKISLHASLHTAWKHTLTLVTVWIVFVIFVQFGFVLSNGVTDTLESSSTLIYSKLHMSLYTNGMQDATLIK
jgi:hypothetical protein